MADELIPITLFVGMYWMIAYMTRVPSDNRVRRELINVNADAATIEHLFLKAKDENPGTSLKWGIVAVAIGGALVAIHLLGLSAEDPLTYGAIFLAGGSALLVHYALIRSTDTGE